MTKIKRTAKPFVNVDNRERFSILKKLRKENKSNDLFEIMLNGLTIEELISAKLELINKNVGSNIYGIPLWRSLEYIVKDALLRYSLASNYSKKNAAIFLGLPNRIFFNLLEKFQVREYHNDIWGQDPNSKGANKCQETSQ